MSDAPTSRPGEGFIVRALRSIRCAVAFADARPGSGRIKRGGVLAGFDITQVGTSTSC